MGSAAARRRSHRPHFMRALLRRAWRVSGMCAVAGGLLLAGAAYAADTTTRTAGGSGGVRYDAACAADQVLAGLVMNATVPTAPLVQWIESAYPICVRVRSDGTWGAQPVAERALSVGGWSARKGGTGDAPSGANRRQCPSGQAVVGFSAYQGTFLDRLQLVCRDMTSPTSTAGSVRLLEWFPNPLPDSVKVPFASCGTLRFEMRRGETIAQLIARVSNQIGSNLRCLNPLEWRTELVDVPSPEPADVIARAAGGPVAVGRTDCPGGRPASGIFGRAGAADVGPRYVDSIGLKCMNETEWRPGYHFSPAVGWMNDPAGLVRFGNTYHLYFQAITSPSPVSAKIFAPEKVVWGHATSSNLLQWSQTDATAGVLRASPNQLGLTIRGGEAPFTGSAVVLDSGDQPCECSSGARCIAPVYTRHQSPAGPQYQVVSTSCSNAQNFARGFQQPGRKILGPVGPHFRDPKVLWYQDARSPSGGFWVMVVAAGDKLKLYRSCSAGSLESCSRHLTAWSELSPVIPAMRFSATALTGPFFETPDLVQLPVENEPGVSKWVVLYAKGFVPSFAAGGQDEYSESWYQVGDFDGRTFRLLGAPRRLDAGPDFYAPQTWFVEPGAGSAPMTLSRPAAGVTSPQLGAARLPGRGAQPPAGARRILAGWQNNWRYAHELPTSRWKGHLAIPRELSLVRVAADDYRLVQQPVGELASLRQGSRPAAWQVRNVTAPGYTVPRFGTQFEANLTIEAVDPNLKEIKIHLRDGSEPGRMIVGWRRSDGRLYLDRSAGYAGGGSAPKGFTHCDKSRAVCHGGAAPPAGYERVFSSDQPVPLKDGRLLELRVLVDRSSVEVFAGDGRVVMSGVFFPHPDNRNFRLSFLGPTVYRMGRRTTLPAAARIVSLDLYELKLP